MPAFHVTQSVQPSTSVSSSSRLARASRCSGVSGMATLVRFTAPEKESGFMISASRSCSSIASKSMRVPRAYLPISASNRGISQGTEANSLACASSCNARKARTSLWSISSERAYSMAFCAINPPAGLLSSGTPWSKLPRTSCDKSPAAWPNCMANDVFASSLTICDGFLRFSGIGSGIGPA